MSVNMTRKQPLKSVLDYLNRLLRCGILQNQDGYTGTWLNTSKKKGTGQNHLHGDMSQSQRDAVMAKFRNKTTSIL
jgi:hypothetical protein